MFDGIASLEVSHDYQNQTDSALEASVEQALPPDCAVTELVVISEDKEIRAKIVDKEKAAERYSDALAQGHAAYKMDLSG